MNGRVLLVECGDRRGLVHGITGVLLRHGLNVVGNQEFVDRETGRFFMRTEVDGELAEEAVVQEVRALVEPAAAVRFAALEPKRVVVLVSREHHCLGDLLIRNLFGELNGRVEAVIGNHGDLADLTRRFGIPFHEVPTTGRGREEQESALTQIVEACRPDFLVLAKYMRILSAGMVAKFRNRIINIHHSFLPAFAGAKPYRQAYDRGVKVIGATAHFVTEGLDEGPIIVQQVIPVDHSHSARDLAAAGRDVEQAVLARALKLVFEDRVFLCGNRTVLFD